MIQPLSYTSLTTTAQQLASYTAELALQSSQQFLRNNMNSSIPQISEKVTSDISVPEPELGVTKKLGRPKLTQYVSKEK